MSMCISESEVQGFMPKPCDHHQFIHLPHWDVPSFASPTSYTSDLIRDWHAPLLCISVTLQPGMLVTPLP